MAKRTVGAAGGAAVALALATGVIVTWEGTVLHGYRDPIGIVTACTGHTKTAILSKVYSPEECRKLLADDLRDHAGPILKCTPAETPVETEAAFVSLAFNIGPTAFCSSSAARFARAGQFWSACNAIGAWNKVRLWPSGKLVVSKGLSNRRAAEVALCLKGLPS